MSAARWTRVAVRLWSALFEALFEAGRTVALQHGIPIAGTQTLINSPVNSPVLGAGETA